MLTSIGAFYSILFLHFVRSESQQKIIQMALRKCGMALYDMNGSEFYFFNCLLQLKVLEMILYVKITAAIEQT